MIRKNIICVKSINKNIIIKKNNDNKRKHLLQVGLRK